LLRTSQEKGTKQTMGVAMTAESEKKAGVKKGLDPVVFRYQFRFEDGKKDDFTIHLDPQTLEYLPGKSLRGDDWTRLEFLQCENCPLKVEHHPHCPAALSVEDMVKAFRERFSYDKAEVTLYTEERIYFKNTTVQKGLSSIMGILLVSSGCPILGKLRPMVRFHLPFASALDTTFRTTSTYLLGQFFVQKRGGVPDFTLQGLTRIYEDIQRVNRAMARRLNALASKDASVNALIVLDMLALTISMSLESEIEELESLFNPLFQ